MCNSQPAEIQFHREGEAMESPRRLQVRLNDTQAFSFAVHRGDTLGDFLARLRPKVSSDLVSEEDGQLLGDNSSRRFSRELSWGFLSSFFSLPFPLSSRLSIASRRALRTLVGPGRVYFALPVMLLFAHL